MRKLLIIYVSILLGVYIVVAALDWNSDYAIEKRLWKVHKKFTEITKDPTVVPENVFDDVANSYQRIAQQYPDSKLTKGVLFLVGEVYELRKDYKTARTKYNEIAQKVNDSPEFSAELMSRIGRTFEAENNWTQAEQTYRKIIKDYPLTNAGLSAPYYIANYYKDRNDFKNTIKAYESAVIFYQDLVKKHPDSEIEFNGLRFLANCYLDQSRWKEGVDALGEALIKYSTDEHMNPTRADIMIKTINIVSAYRLNDYDAAINVYTKFMTTHPEHPLNEYLQKMIDGFTELKDKGIEVAPKE